MPQPDKPEPEAVNSKAVRDLVCLMVQQLGCAPVPLEGSAQCLEALGGQSPALILLDLNMERMQGDECCRRIRENPAYAHIPVVMMTGADAPHEVMQSWRAGADDFLPKPIRKSQLAAKVAAVRASAAGQPERKPAVASREPIKLLLMVDLRASERVPFFSVVEFRAQGDAEWLSGFSYDVSEGGIFIRTLTPLAPVTELEMKISLAALPQGPPCKGMVAWANLFQPRKAFSCPVGMGIRFTEVTGEQAAAIRALVKTASAEAGHLARAG